MSDPRGWQRITDPIGRLLLRLGATLRMGSREQGVQLVSVVDEAAEQEVLEDETQELIHSVFEFGETVVREVMVPRTDMITIEGEADVEAAADRFIASGVSRMPVVGEDSDDILGVLHLRDILRVEQRTALELARPAAFVPESQKADELLRQMQRERFHLALVVDEYGGIAGLVTMEDLIEELVGEISDEHDRDAPELVELPDGRVRVAARYNIEDLGEHFGLELEDDEVDSIGGLLAKALGRVPIPGAQASVSGLVLTAERVEGKRLKTVLVERDEALVAAEAAFPPEERR
ncbi:MAG TPA: hemolysin family protein [Microbacteriaceae bacterium]|nr:hemolysin family protein [Microbacteriaceae bacterium]